MVSMQRPRLIALGAVTVAALAAVLAIGLTHQPSAEEAIPPVEKGSAAQPIAGFKPFTAPALTGKTLDGKPFSLAAYRGRPVVINFWQSYCTPCRDEAPVLARASAALAGKARFVGVDVSDEKGKALRFARSHGWQYALFPDPDYTIGIRYGVVGLPTTYFVDARGRIVDRIVGVATVKAIRDRVAALASA
jgi:cytochrome c biogenesis protein CcmG/thiol:disulfide interchange protein DsbE